MKRLMLVISLLALTFSCTKEEEVQREQVQRPFPEGEKVEVSFSMPLDMAVTKALDGEDALDNIYFAVFGGSGYLKEYVAATPVPDGTYTYETVQTDANDQPVLDEHGDPVTISHTVPKFKFTAKLTMAESRRTVHLIGNAPDVLSFGWDSSVLPSLVTDPGVKGYWQMVSLPKGIRAQKNSDGEYIDKDGNVIPEGGSGYVADATTKAAFQNIALIRNWAKIVVESSPTSNFTPISYAVINVPKKGTYVPYHSGFVQNYQDMSFTQLESSGYLGNLPSSAEFDRFVPPAASFTSNPLGEGVAPAENGAVYLYERPVPSASVQPTFVIIYGYYENSEDFSNRGYYYYKVDLMETRQVGEEEWQSSYYPIYRNFKYKIVVNKILSRGQDTPAKAATSAGSADVSADVTTSGVTDISDGIGRLTIKPWLAQTFTTPHGPDNPVEILSVHFSHDGETDMNPNSVKVELLPMTDGGDPVIYQVPDPDNPEEVLPFLDAPSTIEGNEGYRTIRFCTVAPSELVRTQVLRVTGIYGNNKRLYRDIHITIQPIQPLTVKCQKPFIPKTKGTQEIIDFMIPEGLAESMFPLDFTIEAEDMTLTPDNSVANNNLPVITGTSISEHDGYAGKPAFQFVRTLTWDEYSNATIVTDTQERTWRSISCYFKTTRDISATTVWVYNEFFTKGSVEFEHYRIKEFENLTFTTPIPAYSNEPLTVTFSMQEDAGRIYPDSYPLVEFTANGLLCTTDGVQQGSATGKFRYQPTQKNVTLSFVTTTADTEEIEIEFEADEYEYARLVPCHFAYAGFVDCMSLPLTANKWSNSVYGHIQNKYAVSKTVLFAYKDDALKPQTTVTITLDGLTTTSNTPKFPYTPTASTTWGVDPLYHEIELNTPNYASDADVIVTVSSPGYVTKVVTAGRFKADINTMPFSNGDLGKLKNTSSSQELARDNGRARISLTEVGTNCTGEVVQAGESIVMKVDPVTSGHTTIWVRFQFTTSSGTIMTPDSFEPSVGTVTRYPTKPDMYIWAIPQGTVAPTIRITAPDNRKCQLKGMVVKTLTPAVYYEGGVVQ